MPHWTEDLFIENAALFRSALEARVDAAGDEAEALLSLVESEYDHAPADVLDVGCGIGRHAVEFARAGIDAIGVDVSGRYLDRARERAADAGMADSTAFVQGDMRDLRGLDEYDLVTSVWTSFGFFDDATNRAVLEEFRDRLRTDGVVAIEVANKEGILSAFEAAEVSGDDRLWVETREYEPRDSRMHSTVRVLDETSETYRGRFSFDVRVYAPVELAGLLREAGFVDVATYGSLGGDELTRESTRLVALGRRPP